MHVYLIFIIINGSVKDSVLYNHTITLFNYVRFTVLKILSFSSNCQEGS